MIHTTETQNATETQSISSGESSVPLWYFCGSVVSYVVADREGVS